MNAKKLSIIAIIKLATVTVAQVWPPYEMYDQFYNSYPYQGIKKLFIILSLMLGFGYGGRCTNIILTGVPCQQLAGQWNLYPNYQSQNYNMRPQIGIMSPMFVPYGSDNMMSQSSGITMDLLNRGILLDSAEAAAIRGSVLAPKLLGANILNDKNRFMAHGCSYDTTQSRCTDNLNLCKGKCKNFGDNLIHDCRCIPEDLLTILGLRRFGDKDS
uniref:Secreted protein n=1 Tax=Elaeophora elaphi TaxID=1147741 RepID=A0A0R3RKZ9_9BILA